MLHRAIFLLFLHLVMCSISSPLYPALRYNPLPISSKTVSFQLQDGSPVQSNNLSVEQQQQEEEGFLANPAEKRMQRHADAIFTDHYRKVLGQISARKILQTIIGKRLGQEMEKLFVKPLFAESHSSSHSCSLHNPTSERSPGEGEHEFLTRRQSESILMDSRYHQQMVLKNFLGAILQNQRPQDVNSDHVKDFANTLAKLMKL
ncbi:LOW QUALITY PROTEIN: somatoliberin [Trachemys scripta elegans]|uniref:LOW QUALITY PROTEIN: somatoliberin n=1 Tax=Trachemys scripta elegans TaxID=31138 RepID=UPI001552FA42|nr:LOW QUALITY PROTEIN: somatoliberin [Trachemys scripta elegans]